MSKVLEEVHKFITDQGVGLDSNVERNDEEVRVSIRDGADDEPSIAAQREAQRIVRAVKEKFKDVVKVESEFIDEWVDVTIEEKK